jgi:hypothetical protein
VPLAVAVDVALELRHELGPLGTRPDHAHLALENVQELRQLVDRGGAEERAEPRPPVFPLHPARAHVVGEYEFRGLGRAAREAHGPELQDLEGPAVSADANLTEEDRPAEGDPDHDRCRDQDRGEEYERNRRKKAVERVLDGELHALRVRRVRREEGDPPEVLDAVTLRDTLEEPRHD